MICLYTLASLNFTLSVPEYVKTNVVKLSLFQENNLSNSILHRIKHGGAGGTTAPPKVLNW